MTTLGDLFKRARKRVERDPLVLFGMVGGAYALRGHKPLLYALSAVGAWWLFRDETAEEKPAPAAPAAPAAPVYDPRNFMAPDLGRAEFVARLNAMIPAAVGPAVAAARAEQSRQARPPPPGEW